MRMAYPTESNPQGLYSNYFDVTAATVPDDEIVP